MTTTAPLAEPDYETLTQAVPRGTRTPGGFKEAVQTCCTPVPDLTISVRFVEGDKSTDRVTSQDIQGAPPTDRSRGTRTGGSRVTSL